MSARQALSTDRHGHRHQSAVLAATRPTPSQGSRPRTRCRDVRHATHRSVSPFRALANRRCRDLGEPRRCLRRRCLAAHPGTLRARDGSRRLACRDEVIYERLNITPRSTIGGTMRSHEHVLLFSRTGSYSFDAEALREPAKYQATNFDGTGHEPTMAALATMATLSSARRARCEASGRARRAGTARSAIRP